MSAWGSILYVLAVGVLIAIFVNPLAWVIPGVFVFVVLLVLAFERWDKRHANRRKGAA